MNKIEVHDLPGGTLAYLGDSVFEVKVRQILIEKGYTSCGVLNREALRYVTAVAQSKAAEKILPLLDDEETAVYKRGRNASGLSTPHSATQSEYRRATGLEALFGYLYLKGKTERIDLLFAVCANDIKNEGNV